MKEIQWRVVPDGIPAVLRRCSKCEKQRRFICSDNFRINAQQRTLDVWLIYRCEHCDTTLNLDVYTRVSPKSLDPEEYYLMEKNDAELAHHYASDIAFLHRNKAVADYEGVSYSVEGEELSRGERVSLTILCDYGAGVRLDKILADKTGVSRGEIGRMSERGEITCAAGDITKLKPKGSVKLEITMPT